jgi:ERCC4-related helicase
VGSNTVHFHGVSDFQEMVKAANSVAMRSNLNPRRYQWRAYFFACIQNVLLCLPTGMGKTLIANMLMKAYHQLNPNKAQIFIVPTIVLVEQQSTTIERNTGLKVQRRSGEHNNNAPWSANEICVCTPAMLNQGIKKKQIDMSQISLLVFDEVHEANSSLSEYGLVLPYIAKCHAPHRPRVLALTASPSGANTKNIRECILELCSKMNALPFSPLVGDEKNTDEANGVSCEYIEIAKTAFELSFETFVFETLESLSNLHNFFDSHWKDVQVNVIAQHKANAIEKILSHSDGVSRHNNDEILFQLTMFMKKWLQTLELIRIFGPQKLVQFISADLEHADKNGSLSKIKTMLKPLLPTFRIKIAQMEARFSIAVDSSRTAMLMNKLNQYRNDNARILVFVERRDTAERLSRRLQDDPNIGRMNPEYVVGNSSGGLPKERQQEIMEKFRSGECQVIVATSVLEQGIDVAACNVVICFDGVKTIKSIIQSRGRARKKAASFIVFVSTEGRSRVNELTQMEHAMDSAIKQLMYEKNCKFEPNFDQEIEKFLDGDRDGALEQNDIDTANDDVDDCDEDLEFDDVDESNVLLLRFFNFKDQDALADYISSFFTSPYDNLKLSRNFIVARFMVKEEGITKIIRVSLRLF